MTDKIHVRFIKILNLNMLPLQVRTPRRGPSEVEVAVPAGFLLHKLEEVNQSVKVPCFLYTFVL